MEERTMTSAWDERRDERRDHRKRISPEHDLDMLCVEEAIERVDERVTELDDRIIEKILARMPGVLVAEKVYGGDVVPLRPANAQPMSESLAELDEERIDCIERQCKWLEALCKRIEGQVAEDAAELWRHMSAREHDTSKARPPRSFSEPSPIELRCGPDESDEQTENDDERDEHWSVRTAMIVVAAV